MLSTEFYSILHMGILKQKFPCFVLHLFLLPMIFISASDCHVSSCGSQTIRFPFRLNGISPVMCGYPGFTLTCKAPQNQTILTLPGSGEFLVRQINYLTQTMLVYDQGKCFPKRLVGFNLSHSPFMANLSTNYTLFSCPTQLQRLGFPTISCLTNTTTSVLAILDKTSVGEMVFKSCQKMDTLIVPSGNSADFFMGDVGLQLNWNLPQCNQCEHNGGNCGFNDQKQQLVCYFHPSRGGSKEASTGVQIFKIIAMSIAIPASICAIGVGVFLCILEQEAAVNPQPTIVVIPSNEGITIDTYTNSTQTNDDDDTCPICLSEFNPNETLRCIPECHHCFHSHCIHQWLTINLTCPLCRKLPLPTSMSIAPL